MDTPKIPTLMSYIAAAAFILFVGATPAGAIDFEGINEFTGSNSDNENDISVDHDFDFNFDDEIDISTDFDADLDTGNNDIDDNTLVGDVEFGNIGLGLSLDNTHDNDNNSHNYGQFFGGNNHEVNATFENRVTGSNSNNQNTLDVDSNTDIDINKEKNVDNDFDIDANTGNNDVEDNTVVDGVSGGDIELDIDLSN